MDIEMKLKEHKNGFDLKEIIEFKSKVKNCIWFDCALLENGQKSKSLIAPQPGYAVYFEIDNEDIVEIVPAGYTVTHLENVYKMVKLFVKNDALIIKFTHHYASQITDYLNEVKQAADFKKAKIVSHTNEIRKDFASQSLQSNGGGAHPDPHPSPSPSPHEPQPHEPSAANVRG